MRVCVRTCVRAHVCMRLCVLKHKILNTYSGTGIFLGISAIFKNTFFLFQYSFLNLNFYFSKTFFGGNHMQMVHNIGFILHNNYDIIVFIIFIINIIIQLCVY